MLSFINFFKLYYSKYFTTKAMPRENVWKVDEYKVVDFAADCLGRGEVIAVPTDTVYGLACDANNESAVKRLYEIKGRDFNKPVAIYVKTLNAFRHYGKTDHLSDELLKELLPGPFTIVVERSEHLNNPFLNPSTNLVGMRITYASFLNRLTAFYGMKPLALTSANRSNQPSCVKVSEFSELWPELGGVFDAGQIGNTEDHRYGSTVVDLSVPGYYKIIRDGMALYPGRRILRQFNIQELEINNIKD